MEKNNQTNVRIQDSRQNVVKDAGFTTLGAMRLTYSSHMSFIRPGGSQRALCHSSALRMDLTRQLPPLSFPRLPLLHQTLHLWSRGASQLHCDKFRWGKRPLKQHFHLSQYVYKASSNNVNQQEGLSFQPVLHSEFCWTVASLNSHDLTQL